MTWEEDKRKASLMFKLWVQPKWAEKLNASFVTNEEKEEEFNKKLDEDKGVDLFALLGGLEMIGIANRVIYGKDYRSFTIRYKRDSGTETEFAKRLGQVKEGSFRPKYTMQSYISHYDEKNDPFLSSGMILTDELYSQPVQELAYFKHTGPQQSGGAEFLVIDWDKLIEIGVNIQIINKKQQINKKTQQPLDQFFWNS